MNLNLHIVDVRTSFAKPQNLDALAKAALFSAEPGSQEVLSMVELLDWEHGSDRPRSVLGLRCELALLQMLDDPQLRPVVMDLADVSPCVDVLCALRASRRHAQRLAA